MHDDPDIQHAVNAYRLVIPATPAAQHTGDLLGRGSGSSLEFQEYREYTPGDDVRHLDWAAYARSDALMIRLYREEISPATEVLLDASRSMTTTPGKQRLARQLGAAILLWSAQTGGSGIVALLRDSSPPLRLTLSELPRLAGMPFDGTTPLSDCLPSGRLSSRRHAVRVVISDFLFDADPVPVIRAASESAGMLWVFQLLSPFEANPPTGGGRRLVDVETGEQADVILNPASVAEYKTRLSALQQTLRDACHRARARFHVLVAGQGLPELCRRDLCSVGFLQPR